jgi:hypothetical protein
MFAKEIENINAIKTLACVSRIAVYRERYLQAYFRVSKTTALFLNIDITTL